MKKLISAKLAGNTLLIFLALLEVFHVLVLLKIVPFEIIWGGQIKDASSLVVFEGFAFILTLLFAIIIAIKIDYIKVKSLEKTCQYWCLGDTCILYFKHYWKSNIRGYF